MFDIGFGELLIIAIVALVVLGPERLPKAARFAGLWVRRARAQWHSVRDELERELAADELKRSLSDTEDAMRETERRIRESAAQTAREFDDLRQSVTRPATGAAAGAAAEAAAQDSAAASTAPAGPDDPAAPSEHHETSLASASDPDLLAGVDDAGQGADAADAADDAADARDASHRADERHEPRNV